MESQHYKFKNLPSGRPIKCVTNNEKIWLALSIEERVEIALAFLDYLVKFADDAVKSSLYMLIGTTRTKTAFSITVKDVDASTVAVTYNNSFIHALLDYCSIEPEEQEEAEIPF